MTLTEYLASPAAVEDVRALLVRGSAHHGTATSKIGTVSPFPIWHASIANAWTRIEVAHGGAFERPIACYREPTLGQFIVSDCGEAVSGIMRRTGKHGTEARRLLTYVLLNEIDEDQEAYNAEMSSTIHVECSAADLPAALVSVLSAVAKCAEVK